ncbi:hypothetical protein ASAP_0523 [Asaia bogorensis]|uniref:Uncharacterized protein n=1 Tax=Asaia bogorensis TaxID=91915 RepID=A0A060QCZ8_9PROT|nr:hypothetical protein ASAP_0523 [Asaia bogorensis]
MAERIGAKLAADDQLTISELGHALRERACFDYLFQRHGLNES